MLHFLLLKMYPVAYKRRESQTLEEEKETGYFSPQFNYQACYHRGDPVLFSAVDFESNSSSDPISTREGEPCTKLEPSMSRSVVQDSGACTPIEMSDGNSNDEAIQEKNCKQISVNDVLCLVCKQLLFRPVVLNCGHVYCESCIFPPADKMLKCQACEMLHPRGFPKVFLMLDHFLEKQFPKEYVLRRDAVQLKQVDFERKNPKISSGSAKSDKQGENLPQPDTISSIHFGVGCDSCGIYPITGDRYNCKDCVEKVGFDLCGDCYNTRSKLPGRFNQQHTPEHTFELVRSRYEAIRSNFANMSSLVASQLEDTYLLIDDTEASEYSENGSPAPTSSNGGQENAESN